MSKWWEKPAGSNRVAASEPTRHAGRSIYEERARLRHPVEEWQYIGDLDRDGNWVEAPNPNWLKDAFGWKPLDEFVENRRWGI